MRHDWKNLVWVMSVANEFKRDEVCSLKFDFLGKPLSKGPQHGDLMLIVHENKAFCVVGIERHSESLRLKILWWPPVDFDSTKLPQCEDLTLNTSLLGDRWAYGLDFDENMRGISWSDVTRFQELAHDRKLGTITSSVEDVSFVKRKCVVH